MRVAFVCTGNICRSPTAAAVLTALVAEAGLDGRVTVDSYGLSGWHAGQDMDPRARQALRERGYHHRHRARQLRPADLGGYDLVLAADRGHLRDLARLDPEAARQGRLRLLRSFDPRSAAAGELDVPDPYGGDAAAFTEVLDQVEAACRGLVEELRRRLAG